MEKQKVLRTFSRHLLQLSEGHKIHEDIEVFPPLLSQLHMLKNYFLERELCADILESNLALFKQTGYLVILSYPAGALWLQGS